VLAVPALAAQSNLGTIGGFTYVQSTTNQGPDSDGSVIATCPDGQFLVGGGAESERFKRSNYLHSSAPVDGPDLNIAADDAWGSSFRVGKKGGYADAIAVCADTAPQIVSQTAQVPAGKTGRTTAKCPGDMHVSGGGVAVLGGPSDSFLNSSYPTDGSDKDHTPDDGWTGRAVGTAASDETMEVTAFCVSGRRTYMPHKLSGIKPHGGSASLDYCKGQKGVLSGAGIRISGPGTQAHAVMAIPNDDPTAGNPDTTPEERIVFGAMNRYGTKKSATGWAVCKP
jgi:hypothetical protein